jgi:hypothetical protein
MHSTRVENGTVERMVISRCYFKKDICKLSLAEDLQTIQTIQTVLKKREK